MTNITLTIPDGMTEADILAAVKRQIPRMIADIKEVQERSIRYRRMTDGWYEVVSDEVRFFQPGSDDSQARRVTRLETIIANMLEIPAIKYSGMPTPPLSEEEREELERMRREQG